MKIYKFGGASLKSAEGVRNVASIIQAQPDRNLLVVVSAMGKTTDMLERICYLAHTSQDWGPGLRSLTKYHTDIIDALFPDPSKVLKAVAGIFEFIEREIIKEDDADQVYDQIVSQGEVLSSIIVHHYLMMHNANSHWIDARQYIYTDNSFREGKVDWTKTADRINMMRDTVSNHVVITQGFIATGANGLTTTLGREGSDFSAAIFASSLQAESVTIWKDVTGVMNADPRKHLKPVIFEELPFKEAAEMTYYGASVIHPKTIRPLAIKRIPLYVKNFEDPTL
ncbi:MAG TPA: aspartate kinase, partial [Chryseolinea sp.]|nr:aspartate kinase [Chryseolinea sp.]